MLVIIVLLVVIYQRRKHGIVLHVMAVHYIVAVAEVFAVARIQKQTARAAALAL